MQQFGEVKPTEEQSDDLNATLKRFWDLETIYGDHTSEISDDF